MKNIIITILLLIISGTVLSQSDTIQNESEYKKFYNQNGKISSEGYLKKEKPYGYWISYHISGVKKSEGKWNRGMLDSTWIFYDQVGDTIEKINYYFGKRNGYHFQYFANEGSKNKIASSELYVKGKRNNKAFWYYETGELKKSVPFENDKKQGYGFNYDKEGNVSSFTRYRNNKVVYSEDLNRYNEDGKKSGVWKTFYSNDLLKEESTYVNGKLHGYVKLYSKKGNLIETLRYKDGEIDLTKENYEIGIEIKEEYDVKGNILFQGSFKNNKPVGVHRTFNSKGKVIESETYDIKGNKVSVGIVLNNGKKDSDWVLYYETGNEKAKGRYLNGKKHGLWVYYYQNGRIQQQGSYASDKYTGLWQWYYKTGELLKKEFYIYGQLDGETVEYDELGGIIAKGNNIEGNKEGRWIYNIGDQVYRGSYGMNVKDGTWKSYYLEEGTLSFTGTYLQGKPDGKHIYYYPDKKIKEEQYYSEGKKVRSWSKYNEYGNLVIVIQYKDGVIYKINGEKLNLNGRY